MPDSLRRDIADTLEAAGVGLPGVLREADSYDVVLAYERDESVDEDGWSLDDLNDFIRKIDEAATAKGPKYKRLDAVLAILEEIS